MSRAAGLVFLDDGAQHGSAGGKARLLPAGPLRGPVGAGVLIAWETNVDEPRFTNSEYGSPVLGLGGSEAVSAGSTPFTYVSGQLELNEPVWAA